MCYQLFSIIAFTIYQNSIQPIHAFTKYPCTANQLGIKPLTTFNKHQAIYKIKLHSSKKKDDKKNFDEDGMDAAFRALDGLSEIDFDEEENDTTSGFRDRLKRAISESDDVDKIKFEDQAMAIKKEVEDKEDNLEEEIKLYSKMQQELEFGEENVYENILSDLSDGKDPKEINLSDDVEKIDISLKEIAEPDEDLELKDSFSTDLMDQAIREAVEEVSKSTEVDTGFNFSDIIQDEGMKKDIEKVFEEANRKLLDVVNEIKEEQTIEREKTASDRQKKMSNDEIRLLEAQGSIENLLDKVNTETYEVEEAMKELELTRKQMQQDPLVKLVNFKNAGIAKQSLLALSILFTFRSFGDLLIGNGDITLFAVQLGFGLLFGILFFIS